MTIHESEIKNVNCLLESLESIRSCLENQLTESVDDLRVILEDFSETDSETIQEINIRNLKKIDEHIRTPETPECKPVKLERVKCEEIFLRDKKLNAYIMPLFEIKYTNRYSGVYVKSKQRSYCIQV